MRLRIECVREGVSSGAEAESSGDGGCCGGCEDWKGRRGLGRMIVGTVEVMIAVGGGRMDVSREMQLFRKCQS